MKTRNLLIIVVCLLAAGVAAYFVGAGLERGHQAKTAAAAQSQILSLQAKVASLQSTNHLRAAATWAYSATVALDNRNFGLANDALKTAVTQLDKVDAAAAGVDAQKLATLKQDAAGQHIQVAADLESQRAPLIRLAAGLAALADTAP
jgi:hypothetical protein